MADFRWTAEQAAAILAGGDTLLSANAGSGKTTTVVGKVLWLLGLDVGASGETGEPLPRCESPCRLDEIAAITFTEKAAHDLKRKLREEIEGSERAGELRWEIDRASIGTIHSFCASLLREHALRLGIDPTFSILDERETRTAQDDLLRDVILELLEADDLGVAGLYRDFTLNGWPMSNGAIDLARAALRDLRWHGERYASWCDDDGAALDLALAGDDPDDLAALRHCDALYRVARHALGRWNEWMREENVRDYDALILDTRELLMGDGADAALRSIRERYRILIIDEFQDTDRAQADIALRIGRGVQRPQLLFVGDPKQSIYRFRGADIAVWNDVARELESGRRAALELTRNFRSQPELIDYLNAVGETAIEATGEALEAELPESRVAYSPLEPGLPSRGTAGVEWLEADGKNVDIRRAAEGEQVARRIREMVDGEEEIVDPKDGKLRPCRYRDVAILYRTRTGLEHYQRALDVYRVPFFSAAQGGLASQQEIADVVNALRLIDNPADDLAAFAFLRSPFVGLRDEVLARIAMDRGHRSLLWQAREWLKGDVAWTPPEGEALAAIERTVLARALELLDELAALAARLPLDELAARLIDASGYRLHLLVMAENRDALGNLQAFLRIAEQYRRHPLGTFLDIWRRWDDQDTGLPQAPLYSAADDVVTVTTIHRAKGLEWPVVFLIDGASKIECRSWRQYWSDAERGPLLGPKQADTGPRALDMVRRLELAESAEEARLLYVATTRARDRLIITGPEPKPKTYLEWLQAGRDLPVVADRTAAAELEPPVHGPAPELSWLDRVGEAPLPALARPLEPPPLRWLTSATELMMRANDAEQWKLRYVHGVEPGWSFAPNREGRRRPRPRARHDRPPRARALARRPAREGPPGGRARPHPRRGRRRARRPRARQLPPPRPPLPRRPRARDRPRRLQRRVGPLHRGRALPGAAVPAPGGAAGVAGGGVRSASDGAADADRRLQDA